MRMRMFDTRRDIPTEAKMRMRWGPSHMGALVSVAVPLCGAASGLGGFELSRGEVN